MILKESRRSDLLDELDQLYSDNFEYVDEIENILLRNNANEDDSDPDEGMYSTMSNDDIESAIEEINDLINSKASNTKVELDAVTLKQYRIIQDAIRYFSPRTQEERRELDKLKKIFEIY